MSDWLDVTKPESLVPVSPRSARRLRLLSERLNTDVETMLNRVTSALAIKYLPAGEELPVDPRTIDAPGWP